MLHEKESTLSIPTLNVALDTVLMTAYLQSRLDKQDVMQPGMRVTDVTLLDCKPGKRALLRYTLTTPDAHSHVVVFGKIYTDAALLARVDQVTALLWHRLFAEDANLGVAQPLGVIPELAMLVYLPAEGQFLDEVLIDEDAATSLELTAQWLGSLHQQPLNLTKRFDLANEVTNLGEWVTLIGQHFPEMTAPARRILRYLQEQALELEFETETLIHKDFHYRHVLVEENSITQSSRQRGFTEQRVNVIDFDEVRLGDPNFDLAHFCANLHLLAYRQYGTPRHLRMLEQHFLQTYARSTRQSTTSSLSTQQARFAWFYGYSAIKIARQLCLGFGPAPVPTGEAQRSEVRMILNQGLAAIF